MQAAQKISSEQNPAYVFATAYGFTIDRNPAPRPQSCYKVTGGKVELISYRVQS